MILPVCCHEVMAFSAFSPPRALLAADSIFDGDCAKAAAGTSIRRNNSLNFIKTLILDLAVVVMVIDERGSGADVCIFDRADDNGVVATVVNTGDAAFERDESVV